MSARVFVGNLSYQTTKEELTALLSAAGTIVDVHLPTDRYSGQPRGFAFVEFSSPEEASAAIQQFNGHDLGGRQLRVNEAEERPPRRQGGGGGGHGGGGYGGGHGGGGYGGGHGGRGEYEGGGGGDWDGGRGGPPKSKGSRRGLRARKRSL